MKNITTTVVAEINYDLLTGLDGTLKGGISRAFPLVAPGVVDKVWSSRRVDQ